MGKIGSTILTFLLSIPLTAVGFMAIFGVPQFTPLVASPDDEIIIRDPYEAQPWGQAPEGQMEDAPAFGQQPNSSNAPAWHDQSTSTSQQQHSSQQGRPQQATPQQSFGQQPYSQQSSPQNMQENSQQPNPFGNHLVSAESAPPNNDFQAGHAFGQPVFANNSANNTGRSIPAAFNPNPVPMASHNGMVPNSNHPNTTETSAQLLDWHQASLRLEELGIDRFHLERGVGDSSFLFVCLYNPADTPQVTHRFEAEGSDPLVAVNQVLVQIDGWLQKRFAAERATATNSDFAFGITR